VKRVAAALTAWLDDRAGIRAMRRRWLDEPLPPGTGWWFTLGSVLLFGLGLQTVSGILLALYYAPTPDHAWDSVRFITLAVPGGHFLRGLHHWGASVVVVAAGLHLVRVVVFGSYRKPRELNWLFGLALLGVILALGLTGYLLPWDQRAYWATVVSINIAKLTPVAGEWIAGLLRGGADVGALTLTRWYAIHIVVLPAVLGALVIGHLYLMRRHGISGPIERQAGVPQTFFPYQAARDLTVCGAVSVVLAGLAWYGAPELEAPADPTSSDFVPRPEWYFLGLFQLLKYFPGRLEVFGALVIPGLAAILLALLPWIDRGRSREWRSRRVVLGAFAAGVTGVIALTVLGALDRSSRTSSWSVRELAGAVLLTSGDRCTKCHRADGAAAPIEAGRISRAQDWLAMHVADPEVIAAGLREPLPSDEREIAAIGAALARLRAGPAPMLDDPTRRIMVVMNATCLGCHIIDGVGGTDGPELSKVGRLYDAASIERRIVNPAAVKPGAQMPALGGKLTPEEIRDIARWLAAKK